MQQPQSFLSRLRQSPFVKDASVLGVALNARLLFGIVQGLLVARWLGPSSYGVAVLVMAVPDLLFSIVDVRSGEVTVKYLKEFMGSPEKAASIFRLGVAVDIGIATLVVVVVALFGGYVGSLMFKGAADAGLMLLYAVSFPVRSLGSTTSSVLTVERRWISISWLEFSSSAVRLVATLALVASGAGVRGVIVGNVVYGVVRGISFGMVGCFAYRRLWGQPFFGSILRGLGDRRTEITKFLAFSDLAGLIAILTKQADLLLVGAILGPRSAGLYRAARNLPGLWTLAGEPLQRISYERLAGLMVEDRASIPAYLRGLTSKIGLPLWLLVMASAAAVPMVIALALGSDYSGAVAPAVLFVFASGAGALVFWLRPAFMSSGSPGLYAMTSLAVGVVFILLALPALTIAGITGLAVLFAAVQYLGAAFMVRILWRRLSEVVECGSSEPS